MELPDSKDMLQERLRELRLEHRALDAAVRALVDTRSADMLHMARLKKRKLRLKDEITALSNLLTPDIIA